jgi:hypothetical protein
MTHAVHLSREELDRWRTHGDPEDRARVVSHLADCDECGARYAELLDQLPVAAGDLEPAPRDLVARAYRLYPPARSGIRWWSHPWRVAAGAAAAVILAVAVPALRDHATPIVVDDGGIRGNALQAIGPIGTVRPPVSFRWVSPVMAVRYSVEVRGPGDTLLFTLSSETESVDLPSGRLVELAVGQRYTWQVVAMTAAGEEIMRSPPQPFVVSPEGR